MDRYTLMCSKLTQLQEEKVLGFKDEVWYKSEIYSIIDTVSSYPIFLYTIKSENYNEMPVVPPNELIYRPTLEDLIKMLGKISWRLRKVEVDVNRYSYEAWTWKMPENGLWAGTPQKALLKLVAYERWGLRYNEENETW